MLEFKANQLLVLALVLVAGIFVGFVIGQRIGYDQGIVETLDMYENFEAPILKNQFKIQTNRFLKNKQLLQRVQ